MDCFHFLNDDKNWNVCRFHTSVIGFSIPVQLPVSFKFLFWFFSSANMNIMLTTVVKTHRLSRVCVCVCTWGWKHLNRNHKCTSNILTHSRSRPSLPGTVKPPRQLLLLLLLHGTNNRNNTLCYSYYYVLICHASSLQYCFYISLYYTERRKKSDQGAGSCWISHTQCQTNFYSWFYSLWVDTKGVLLLSLSHKIMVMIVIAIFIIIIKKKTTFSGHHKYNEPKGAKRNVWNNLNISDIHSFGCFFYVQYIFIFV